MINLRRYRTSFLCGDALSIRSTAGHLKAEAGQTGVRTFIYTTNAIESLNATYRRLNRQRSVFSSDQALLKALYLAAFEAVRKWTMPVRNWSKVYGKLVIM